jgi:predicted nucleic acid-binding protein
MGLTLKKDDVIFLDTSPFIYFFERHQTFFPYMEKLFNQVEEQEAQVIASIVTFIEIATLPARLGNRELVDQYRSYFVNSNRVRLLSVDQTIAEHSVALRAKYRLKTPDAIQLGTAIAYQANYIVTNDRQWKQLTNQTVLTVEEIGLERQDREFNQ